MSMRTNMTDEKVDLLCDGCDQTLADFLTEIAEQNAKVATCPKCGKIHEFSPKDRQARGAIRQES